MGQYGNLYILLGNLENSLNRTQFTEYSWPVLQETRENKIVYKSSLLKTGACDLITYSESLLLMQEFSSKYLISLKSCVVS